MLHNIHTLAKSQSDSVLETEENPQELNISREAKTPAGEDYIEEEKHDSNP